MCCHRRVSQHNNNGYLRSSLLVYLFYVWQIEVSSLLAGREGTVGINVQRQKGVIIFLNILLCNKCADLK